MKKLFTKRAHEGIKHWSASDPEILKKILKLIEDIEKTPFQGLGKPEPLKGNFSGCWSRRITQEHRLIYKVGGHGENTVITILQCRYHYNG